MADTGQDGLWTLGFSDEYVALDSHAPTSKIERVFVWDRVHEQFVLNCTVDGKAALPICMSVPVALAEQFLLFCRERRNCEHFLIDSEPAAQHVVELGDAALHLYRGRMFVRGGREHYPGLTLQLKRGDVSVQMRLSHQVRKRFGEHLLKLTEDDIRANLYASVAA